ncbi:MAG TPA: histidine phosphatase family protein [Rhodospirillales bacterium]|jgi:broad specificity phosphatase PhoE|nr:MAG: Adenosylcobalamin/alpha-ribazole phosphatase [Alphaproteobacteria bacterium MarineAlpha3_Bin2]HIC29377.1 histidine phosphatase family protein [Rhodospirillales bacterium]
MSDVTRWWWVRHAPVVNGEGMIYGSSDIDCDVSDTAHFKTLAQVLPKDAVWFTSHLTRTKKTAQAIAEAGLDFPEPIVEEDLGEQNFGDWQGLSWNQMMKADPETYNIYWSDPTRNRPPGGESFADQIARTGVVIDRLGEQHKGRNIVAVAHGGTIRAAMAVALKLEPEQGMAIRVDTLSVSIFENVEDGLLRGKGGVWRVVGVNRVVQE